ncbi:MAG: RNA polymerase sigma factor [Pseudobdellovibrionaceae bacterium]
MIEYEIIQLVKRLGPQFYRFFLARTTKAEAEDLVQEVFVRLIQSNYSSKFGTLEAFAWGIAQNVNKESKRKAAKAHVLTDEISEMAGVNTLPNHDDVVALQKSVALLDEPQRTILQMILADLEIHQIAMQLAMPEGTVKSHIHRAKENIKIAFRKWGFL